MTPLRLGALLFVALASAGCRSAYYGTMERFGVHKRDILVDRVEEGREEQQEAKEQFQTTLEAFQELTGFEGGDLEALYSRLDEEYERSVDQAGEVRDRIRSIERVAADLFEEWEDEIGEMSSPDLKRQSEEMLDETRERYGTLIEAMQRAEARMEPVLVAFRDHVLFLKHNLNARAIDSLRGTVVDVADEVSALVSEMQASIDEADAFIASMETDEA